MSLNAPHTTDWYLAQFGVVRWLPRDEQDSLQEQLGADTQSQQVAGTEGVSSGIEQEVPIAIEAPEERSSEEKAALVEQLQANLQKVFAGESAATQSEKSAPQNAPQDLTPQQLESEVEPQINEATEPSAAAIPPVGVVALPHGENLLLFEQRDAFAPGLDNQELALMKSIVFALNISANSELPHFHWPPMPDMPFSSKDLQQALKGFLSRWQCKQIYIFGLDTELAESVRSDCTVHSLPALFAMLRDANLKKAAWSVLGEIE